MIRKATRNDYNELIRIWEASVRATHHFLPDADIVYFRGRILEQYFDLVRLFCIENDGPIYGFIGLSKDKIEMLFIDPASFGQGYGGKLTDFAIRQYGITKVDVNEDNEQATGFYRKKGFEVVSRSAKDAEGKNYPILHMELSTNS